jgi:two-component system response regulator (stage 0 sporulation protein F)
MIPCSTDMAEKEKAKNKTKTVLVVDDEMENRRTYGEILERMDCTVMVRPDGESALALLRDKDCTVIDAVITDYRMPGMNGIEFVTELRRSLPDVPVIMVTAYGNIETYLQSVSLGVFEFVHKPVRMEELERIVRHVLRPAGPDGAGEEAP